MPADQAYKPETIKEALRLMGEGVPATRVSKTLNVPASTVRRWAARYAPAASVQEIAKTAASLRGVGRPRESK